MNAKRLHALTAAGFRVRPTCRTCEHGKRGRTSEGMVSCDLSGVEVPTCGWCPEYLPDGKFRAYMKQVDLPQRMLDKNDRPPESPS